MINKGKEAEQALAKFLSNKVFSHYVYLNPTLRKGKELCDALIILQNKAVIFQTKKIEYKDNQSSQRKFEKNIKQCHGAYRSLLSCTDIVELVNYAGYSESIDTSGIDEIYCVAIHHGHPAFIRILRNKDSVFVHTINYESFQKMLNELSALPDLFRYLNDKKKLRGGKILFKGGEEDLFALWIFKEYSFDELSKQSELIVERGLYDLLINKDKQYQIRKQEDAKYIPHWENLISMSLDMRDKRLSDILVDNNFLARRALGKQFSEFCQKMSTSKTPGMCGIYTQFNSVPNKAEVLYLFVGLGQDGDTGLSYSHLQAVELITIACLRNYKQNGHTLASLKKVVFLITDCILTRESAWRFGVMELPVNWVDTLPDEPYWDDIAKQFGLSGDILQFSLISDYAEGVTPFESKNIEEIEAQINEDDQNFWL